MPGMVAHACAPSTWEVETGVSEVQDHPWWEGESFGPTWANENLSQKGKKNLGKRCQWLHQRQQFGAELLASCDSVNMPGWGWFHSVSPVTLPFLWLPFMWDLHLFQPSSTVRWCFSWALILLLHCPLNPDTLWVSFHGWSNSGLFSLSYQIFCYLLYSLKDCNKP